MSDTTIGGVTSVVTADTTQFDQAYKKLGQTADATSRTVAKAAKLQAEAEAFAAKYAGDAITEKSLRIIAALKGEKQALAEYSKAQRLVRDGYGDEAESSKLLAAAFQRLTTARLESAEAAKVESEATEHAAVSQQQAASAAIRTLEGNTGIRAVERFLISIPGVGFALKSIFPVIGLVATADILVKMTEDVYELEQKGKHAGEEIARAFAEMNVKIAAGNDELELQTAKIEQQIAKLEKRPGDGLKVALMESAVAADKLQEALSAVLKAQNDVFKQQHVGAFEALLSNVGTTGGAEKSAADLGKEVERQSEAARIARRQAMLDAGSDQAKQEAASRAYYARMDQIAADAARKMRARATEIADRQKVNLADQLVKSGVTNAAGGFSPRDLTPARVMYEKSAEMYDELQRRAQDAGEQFFAQGKFDGLSSQKDSQKNAVEEQRKAFEERKRILDQELTDLKNDHLLNASEEYSFWAQKVAIAKAGSLEWNYVYGKMGDANQASLRELEALANKYAAAAQRQIAAQRRVDQELQRAADEADKAQSRLAESSAKYVQAIEENTIQMEQLQVAHDLATGAISKYDAAMQAAALHVASYRAELSRLDDEQKALDSRHDLYIDDRRAMQLDLDTKRANVEGRAQRTAVADSRSIDQQTVGGSARSSLEGILAQSRDTAAQVRQFVDETARSLNTQIVRGMTGQRTDFTGMGRDIFANIAGAGLNKAEGSILQMFGLGGKKKPTGAAGDALHTIVDNPLTDAVGSVPFSSLLPGGSPGEDSGGKGISGFLTGLFAGGFADGGYASPGKLMLVGEEGPELIPTGGGRTVIPNHAIPNMLGGGDSHYYTIDARGAHDPAAVEAAVQRGIARAAPGIVAASVAAGQERNRRLPSTSPR